MSDTSDPQEPDADYPEGEHFLNTIFAMEDQCERATDERLPKLGSRAPRCYEMLGSVLSLMDRLSSCWWGCAKGSHAVEYLMGIACSRARAGIRLMRLGFYDEAVGQARGVGEIANLLYLFNEDPGALTAWREADDKVRKNQFGAFEVRLALEQLGRQPIVERDRYGALSRVGVHPHGRGPQAGYVPLPMPLAPGRFLETGLLASLNEIALSAIVVAVMGCTLIQVPSDVRDHARFITLEAIEQVGAVNVLSLSRMWADLLRGHSEEERNGD